jgi:hypothetical protein
MAPSLIRFAVCQNVYDLGVVIDLVDPSTHPTLKNKFEPYKLTGLTSQQVEGFGS